MQIYLAPMEGITTFVYRNALHHHYGGVDKYFTPFLSSQKLNYKEINDISPEHNEGIPLVPQILANRAETFLAIAEQLAEYGYREVNLNLGCPSGTVVSRKRGAGFLSVPWLLDAFLTEIYEKCPLKISIKTRIGIVSTDEWEDILKIYAKYPITELIIHPRLQREFYNGTPHIEAFRLAQDALSLPLVYNGDIFSVDSLEKLREQTAPINAVMLGRGILSNPELPRSLSRRSSDSAPRERAAEPSLLLAQARASRSLSRRSSDSAPRERAAEPSSLLAQKSPVPETSPETRDLQTFRAFHDEILEGYLELMSGEQPVLFRMKELWTYMRRYLDLSDKQLKQLQKTNHLSDYKALVRNFLSQ